MGYRNCLLVISSRFLSFVRDHLCSRSSCLRGWHPSLPSPGRHLPTETYLGRSRTNTCHYSDVQTGRPLRGPGGPLHSFEETTPLRLGNSKSDRKRCNIFSPRWTKFPFRTYFAVDRGLS